MFLFYDFYVFVSWFDFYLLIPLCFDAWLKSQKSCSLPQWRGNQQQLLGQPRRLDRSEMS